MFVRVKKIAGHEYLYLVENAREGGRHVKRVVKALGRREAVVESGLLDGLIASAARQSRRSIVLSAFYRGELAELRRASIGPDLVFGRLWEELGCRAVLSELLAGRRFGADLERAVYLTVLHRLMVSGSDRHASSWRRGLRIPGAEDLTLDDAYQAMAWLGSPGADGRPLCEAIEEALYRRRQPALGLEPRGGAVSVAFFDTTTLWFEGRGGATLGRRGHSKDYRPHLRQVVLGLVLDERDRPIASFLLPGNTADVTLLLPVVARLRERFGIGAACVVADRGLISAAAIAALDKAGVGYILGVRERASRDVRDQVLDDDGLPVPLVIPRQKGETQLAIREVTVAGRRYIRCRNEEEAAKDAAARAEILAGLERKLAQGDKTLVANQGYRRFLKTPAGDGFAIDPQKVADDARFDGLFVLRTNTALSALQVVLRYRQLLAVEDAFKTAKTILATRPIFHKTDAGIRGHVCCTFLAMVLRHDLLDRLAAARAKLVFGPAEGRTRRPAARPARQPPEWRRLIDDLADLSEIDIEQDGRRARLRTAPGPAIDPLCRALGLALPPVYQELPPAR